MSRGSWFSNRFPNITKHEDQPIQPTAEAMGGERCALMHRSRLLSVGVLAIALGTVRSLRLNITANTGRPAGQASEAEVHTS